ncbi:MAG TPA: GatB/YqeY domain-containing protein [Bacteroidales bacterium]|nr:GatB/YqeY domain-containing protein [Bacteroidales bacterium]
MNLAEQIDADLKAAMIARDEVRKLTIRGIKKEIIEAKTAPGANGEITDDTIMKIVTKLLKQRKDSAAIYIQQNRPELAENELLEASILESYLPKQMSAEELDVAVKAIVAQTGAAGPKDMGKVMGVASKQLAGKAEGRLISEAVKNVLNSL